MSARGEGKRGIADLAALADAGEPIVMVTAYDHPSAQIVEAAGVDVVLVGDSAAMTVLGYDSTVPVTIAEMIMLTKAVRRGLTKPLLVADLPFGSYEASDELAVATAQRFVKETGCDAVKVERGGTTADRARAIVRSGVPVMGHVGLTPQTATALGGYRAQGRTAEAAVALCDEAAALEAAGCFSIVVEAVPAEMTELLVETITVPTIGIGAGPATDGQVLVYHDLLGIYGGPTARFVKKYATIRDDMIAGVAAYANDVRQRTYPAAEHTYAMRDGEFERLRQLLDDA